MINSDDVRRKGTIKDFQPRLNDRDTDSLRNKSYRKS